MVASPLSNGQDVAILGALPTYTHIEASLSGGVRLAVSRLRKATGEEQESVLAGLQERFDFPVEIVPRSRVPRYEQQRIALGEDVVFYGNEDEERFFVITPLRRDDQFLRFGPFPSFARVERRALTTTLALTLLLAGLAIAFLLRPVARQLRTVENAAKAIAAGDLSARVDERRVRSARPLAQAFNNMAERTETLVRTQRELLQAVSHELRTPLTRMQFAIELIRSAKDDAQRQQRLDSLDAATEELNSLVSELLSYVRMETTDLPLEGEWIALTNVLDSLIPKFATLHPSIRFEVEDGSSEEIQPVYADRAGLVRVLNNLLDNAARYARNRVTLTATRQDAAVQIDVDDDGSGIPDAERGRVLEPFIRLRSEENDHGVGLGLALVQRILARHGGRIEVLSNPWGGCRIRTSWPCPSGALPGSEMS